MPLREGTKRILFPEYYGKKDRIENLEKTRNKIGFLTAAGIIGYGLYNGDFESLSGVIKVGLESVVGRVIVQAPFNYKINSLYEKLKDTKLDEKGINLLFGKFEGKG